MVGVVMRQQNKPSSSHECCRYEYVEKYSKTLDEFQNVHLALKKLWADVIERIFLQSFNKLLHLDLLLVQKCKYKSLSHTEIESYV